jgi:hypothetical protein
MQSACYQALSALYEQMLIPPSLNPPNANTIPKSHHDQCLHCFQPCFEPLLKKNSVNRFSCVCPTSNYVATQDPDCPMPNAPGDDWLTSLLTSGFCGANEEVRPALAPRKLIQTRRIPENMEGTKKTISHPKLSSVTEAALENGIVRPMRILLKKVNPCLAYFFSLVGIATPSPSNCRGISI